MIAVLEQGELTKAQILVTRRGPPMCRWTLGRPNHTVRMVAAILAAADAHRVPGDATDRVGDGERLAARLHGVLEDW